jgi:hypothetical protein
MARVLFFIISFTLITQISYSQHQFPHLKYVQISEYKNVQFGFPKSESFTLFNKLCSEIDSCLDYEEEHLVYIGEWKIDKQTALDIYFTAAPSDDHRFIVSMEDSIIFEENGTNLHLFKNNTLYVDGKSNEYFNKRRKFNFDNNFYKEVKQPLYFVGESGHLNFPISIFKSEEFKLKIATLPKNYFIEILLAKYTKDELTHLLIKTDYGLIGWFDSNSVSLNKPLINEFRFFGD